ncbi:MAG: Gfo/Idh/MocA family oxidoreductase [Nocardiopsaceae bacterium]|nr:Gfo/Idh/MocA family oxidoreductase [Nocardiopsaceae bacterium]
MELRVGIVGTESSHVDHIIDYLNVARARAGVRVTALVPGPGGGAGGGAGTGAEAGERVRELCRAGGIDLVAGDVPALLDVADALIVTARHGGSHRDLALPFLEAGRPVLVDKPFACRVADAEEMLRVADARGALVTSYSALRYLPATEELAAEFGAIGPARSVVATGPADEESEYGGIFFYGIHPVDVALRLAPGPVGEVRVDRVAESIVASATAGGARVTVNLVKPGPAGPGDPGGPVPFHALAVGRHGIAARELPTDGNYLAPGLEAFLGMIDGTVPPLPPDDLLRPIAFLEAIDQSLKTRNPHSPERIVPTPPLSPDSALLSDLSVPLPSVTHPHAGYIRHRKPLPHPCPASKPPGSC